ncbi:MAG: nicotinamide riboside transporter PnuC [Saprospiraceae bacterium]
MIYINVFNNIVAEAAALGWVDWVVTVTALVYVVLAARENIWAWGWGIVSCGLWAYASFFLYNLWLDALLQLFYVGMGVVGIYKWMGKGRVEQAKDSGKSVLDEEIVASSALPITQLTIHQHLMIIIGGAFIAVVFGYFFDVYTPAAATYLDAFVTVFSIVTTFLLVQKKLDNWAYWVVIDAASIYLFASRGAYLFAFIMLVYTVIAANAFWQWRNTYNAAAKHT